MSSVLALLPSIPPLRNARVVRKLRSGPVATNWLLDIAGTQAVLRVDQPLAGQLGLDRDTEWAVLSQASAAGFAPRPLWLDAAQGLFVKEFVAGDTWQESGPQHLSLLGQRIAELHAADIAAPLANLAARIHRYAGQLPSAMASDMAAEALAIADGMSGCPVCCHNDLGFANIVGQQPVRFIDWEYAAAVDPLFDLAGAIVQNGLTYRQLGELLTGYEAVAGPVDQSQLAEACRLYDLIAAIWYQVVCNQLPFADELNRLRDVSIVRVRRGWSMPRRDKL